MADTLLTTEWLSDHLDDPDLVVLDWAASMEQGEIGLIVESGRFGYALVTSPLPPPS